MADPELPTVAELVRRTLAEDREAFDLLVRQYSGPMTALAYDRLGTVAEAQDAVQETWLTVFRRLRELRDTERFGAWAYEILRNVCAMHLRRLGIDRRAVDVLAEKRAGQGELTPLERAMRNERSLALRKAIEGLSPPLREIVVLRYIGGADRPTTAELLGITLDAADKRLERAMKELRAVLR